MPTKPQVLHIIARLELGGVNSATLTLTSSSLADDFDLAVVAMAEANQAIAHLRPNVVVIEYACSWRKLPRLIWYKFLAKYHNRAAKLVMREHHYCQQFEQLLVPIKSRFRLMLRLSYGLCDRLIAVSQGQAEWLLTSQLVAPEQLRVITSCRPLAQFLNLDASNAASRSIDNSAPHSEPGSETSSIDNSANHDQSNSIPPAPAAPNNTSNQLKLPIQLAAYGRFSYQKGFDLLIQAMSLVAASQFHLHLAGAGADQAALQALIEKLELSDRITMYDRLDHVPHFLRNMDVVVIPSRYEPFGLVCLEAKAAGKPVIATQIDGLSEQVQNCGLLVQSGQPEALATAIKSLLNLPAGQWQKWRRQARVETAEAWKKHLDRWRQELWQLVDRSLGA